MTLQNPLTLVDPAPNQAADSLPVPTGALVAADVRRVRDSLGHSVSDNTRAMYASAWRSFQAWTEARGLLTLPASPSLVAAYLAHLAEERNLSVATVRLHKAALAAFHRASGHDDPTDNEGVKRVMQGIARAKGRAQKQAKPLTAEALAAVKATARSRRSLGNGNRAESAERASWRGRVDVALLSVLRDGLLRRSEAAALTWADVDLRDDGAALLQVGRRVQAAARAAGLGDGFTGHSGRVGMAQDLVKNGVELPALMTAGRWKSAKMPARYTERQAADRGAVARYYQGRGGYSIADQK